MDKIEGMIRSLQMGPKTPSTPSPVPYQNTGRDNNQTNRDRNFRPNTRTTQTNNNRRNVQDRRQFVRPFSDTGQRQPLATADCTQSTGPNSNTPQRRPPGLRRGVCWVCRRPGCHSDMHANRPQSPSRPRTPGSCWICGNQDCRSWYHSNDTRPVTPPVPSPFPNDQENGTGTRRPGNRAPQLPARLPSH